MDLLAVEELKLSYYEKETQTFTIYPCSGNLTEVSQQQPSRCRQEEELD